MYIHVGLYTCWGNVYGTCGQKPEDIIVLETLKIETALGQVRGIYK